MTVNTIVYSSNLLQIKHKKSTLKILVFTLHFLRHWFGLLVLPLPRFFDFLNILFLNVFHLQLVDGEGLGEGELVSQEPRVEGDHSPSLPH